MLRRAKSMRAEEEEDASYFTYRPLSNLPTPPPTSRHQSPGACPAGALAGPQPAPLDRKFLGTYEADYVLRGGRGRESTRAQCVVCWSPPSIYMCV
jgi:hypothetical protein